LHCCLFYSIVDGEEKKSFLTSTTDGVSDAPPPLPPRPCSLSASATTSLQGDDHIQNFSPTQQKQKSFDKKFEEVAASNLTKKEVGPLHSMTHGFDNNGLNRSDNVSTLKQEFGTNIDDVKHSRKNDVTLDRGVTVSHNGTGDHVTVSHNGTADDTGSVSHNGFVGNTVTVSHNDAGHNTTVSHSSPISPKVCPDVGRVTVGHNSSIGHKSSIGHNGTIVHNGTDRPNAGVGHLTVGHNCTVGHNGAAGQNVLVGQRVSIPVPSRISDIVESGLAPNLFFDEEESSVELSVDDDNDEMSVTEPLELDQVSMP
jgi:hypothetical protein